MDTSNSDTNGLFVAGMHQVFEHQVTEKDQRPFVREQLLSFSDHEHLLLNNTSEAIFGEGN